MDLETLFGGMRMVQANAQANFFKTGLYVCETKSFEVRDGYKGLRFIAKLVVKKSNNPEVEVGSTRSWFVKLDGNKSEKERAVGDIKAFFLALTGHPEQVAKNPEKYPEEHKEAFGLFAACGDPDTANEMAGELIALEATEVGTKSGGRFTRHTWSPAS